MPLKFVKDCRMGDAVGNENRTLYVFMEDPKPTEQGTVRARIALVKKWPPDVSPFSVASGKTPPSDDVVFETREWLCALTPRNEQGLARVHVR